MDFLNTNLIDIEEDDNEDNKENENENENIFNNKEDENENYQNEENNNSIKIIPSSRKKKAKYNFYLNKSFLFSSDLDDETKYKIKQVYALTRINFIIKKTREYLNKKYTKKNSLENLKNLLQKNNRNNSKAKTQLFSSSQNNIFINLNNNNFNLLKKKNYMTYNNIVNKEINEIEQKNLKLINRTLYTNSKRLRDTKEGVHVMKLNDNSYLFGKYSSNKKIYYSKTYFDNCDILKSYNDVTKTKIYGIYYYNKVGCVYEGYWENNVKTDIGIEKRWDGTKYEGEYKDGKKNGIGLYIWEDNSIYFGEWCNNNIHGYGIFKNEDKSKYQGEFLFNKRNGYGELIKYKNGTFYFGYWKNNKKEGFGVEFSPRNNGNNKIYIGFWKGKNRHGLGIVLNKIKKKDNIFGLWKENKNSKSFKHLDEFLKKISSAGFSNYIPFFIKQYEEYEEIIKIMIDSAEYIRNYLS